MMADDAEFRLDVGSSSGESFLSRSSTPFLLRSACHHFGPCHEGHGLQFHSRISPSPSRSSHRRRRRQSWVPPLDSHDETTEASLLRSIGARRDLSEDLARVERTSGWVANLNENEVETRSLKLTTTTTKSTVSIEKIILKAIYNSAISRTYRVENNIKEFQIEYAQKYFLNSKNSKKT
jgi:hypothetical protein